MISWLVHRLLVLATILTLVGGTTLQAMPRLSGDGARPVVVTVVPICDSSSAMMAAADDRSDQPPCDTTADDCVKQIDCTDALSCPRVTLLGTRVTFTTINYWIAVLALGGLLHEPDLFPPISG